MSNPSRFDLTGMTLLSAAGGRLFNDYCLQPDYNTMQIDVRLADDESPLLEGTRCILTMGEYTCHHLLPETRANTLGEVRGGLYYYKGIPTIPTFNPQDAADIKAYEQSFNKDAKDYSGDDSLSESGDEEDGDGKRHGKTKRSNYAFWIRADTKKCKHILSMGTSFLERPSPSFRLYPPSDTVINTLTETKGRHLYLDIETDYEKQNLLCFSFSFDGVTVYSVPVLDYQYHWAYPTIHFILRALSIAIRNNTIVAHNGAAFDFFVLGYKYKIPINKSYDTMLAMHRCFPDVEKSLGHCTSYWTWENFHKDSDSKAYRTHSDMMAKLQYCAKDVYTMALIKDGIDTYAKTIPGLTDSIECAMHSIKPYLTTTLQGIRFIEERRQKVIRDNDIILNKYLMLINYLIGDESVKAVKKNAAGKYSQKAFPNSNKQCVKYFHDLLGYPVVYRNPPDRKGIRNPSLAKLNLYKLQLKHDNPVIALTAVFRCIAKESSMLKFTPWRDDNNKIIDYDTYENIQRSPNLQGELRTTNGQDLGVNTDTKEDGEG
jgi:hypothetical protein